MTVGIYMLGIQEYNIIKVAQDMKVHDVTHRMNWCLMSVRHNKLNSGGWYRILRIEAKLECVHFFLRSQLSICDTHSQRRTANLVQRLAHDLYREPPDFKIIRFDEFNPYFPAAPTHRSYVNTYKIFLRSNAPTGQPSVWISLSSFPSLLAAIEAIILIQNGWGPQPRDRSDVAEH